MEVLVHLVHVVRLEVEVGLTVRGRAEDYVVAGGGGRVGVDVGQGLEVR